MNWFDNEAFWSLFYDWMFPQSSFQEAAAQTGDIMALTGIHQGTVLDLCCGPVRFSVTGVDLQPALIGKAMDYANTERVDIEYVEDNMLTFKRENAFDLVISMFSSFGYFNDPEDDLNVLRKLHASLRATPRKCPTAI